MRRSVFTAVLTYILLLSAVMLYRYPIARPEREGALFAALGVSEIQPMTVTAEPSEHFYDRPVTVTLESRTPGAVIHYTLDGTQPTRESPVYTEPFELALIEGQTAVTTVKALAFTADRGDGTLLIHSYLLDRDIRSRFQTPVFILSADDTHLYDYEQGILVEGLIREKWLEANPDVVVAGNPPANYNIRGMEGERPVTVEVFTPEGERVIAQSAGLRVHGGYSRAIWYKSLKLIARSEYDAEHSTFDYDFFPGHAADDGTPIVSYDRLVLRNSQRNYSLLRDATGSLLAAETGLSVHLPINGAAVYLQGEYHVFVYVQPAQDSHFLQDVLDTESREFETAEHSEKRLRSSDSDEATVSIRSLLDIAEEQYPLSDDMADHIDEQMDIDYMLRYYAFQTYIDNQDWPGNNFTIWRYIGGEEEHPYTDGRWRGLLYDMDGSLGYNKKTSDHDNLSVLMGEIDNCSPMLRSFLSNDALARDFTRYLCDMAAIVTVERVRESMDTLLSPELLYELKHAVALGRLGANTTIEDIITEAETMVAFVRDRFAYIDEATAAAFDWRTDERFTVRAGEHVVISSVSVRQAVYFAGLTVPVSADVPAGYRLSHWLVNGLRRDTQSLELTAGDADGGIIEVEAVLESLAVPLAFQQVVPGEKDSLCLLVNPNEHTVNTEGFYLSDSETNLQRWAFPTRSIAPGVVLTLVGSNFSSTHALLKTPLNFNITRGEMLYLSDEAGTILAVYAVE